MLRRRIGVILSAEDDPPRDAVVGERCEQAIIICHSSARMAAAVVHFWADGFACGVYGLSERGSGAVVSTANKVLNG